MRQEKITELQQIFNQNTIRVGLYVRPNAQMYVQLYIRQSFNMYELLLTNLLLWYQEIMLLSVC